MKHNEIIKSAFIGNLLSRYSGDQDMDYTLAQATQPSPLFLDRAKNKGVLNKYYNDKVSQDYAINPALGDTGTPAKAIPVVEQAPTQSNPPSITYPSAKPATDFNALFKKHHATTFDPKSRMDRVKMEKLKAKFGS